MGKPVRVLIVDDSALIRQLLTTLLAADPEIEVVGTADDPYVARDRIKALNPDVVTLDVEMPHMDGITFLRKIMTLRPMPVIMISTLTQAGADVTLEALEIGAVDFIAKPSTDAAHALPALAKELQAKVKAAARTRIATRAAVAPAQVKRVPRSVRPNGKIVAIGASTGGVEALKVVLTSLPKDCPPIVITQHMPPRFTAAFAQRLDRECAMAIKEAADGDVLEQGHVYIAPGSHHLQVIKTPTGYRCALDDGAPVTGHRPSVDVLFRSMARAVGRSAVGVILTGMGKDGADGLLELRKAGGLTIGQDEASSLIYGMPHVAFERGGVMRQCSLTQMADAILDACEGRSEARGVAHAV